MDQSYSDNDISLSPSQILERLHTLRQLQLLQRGKLQKQCLNYQESPENSSSITEIVSHFSNSTSYNTFRSLLESADAISNEVTPRSEVSGISKIVGEKDLIDGVSLLNLSQESELIIKSPISTTSQPSAASKPANHGNATAPLNTVCSFDKKRISLDEMPILSPKKDFEALIVEKLNADKKAPKSPQNSKLDLAGRKKPFLKRGQGMSRFGIGKKNLVIQTTNSLPWKKNAATKQMNMKPTTPPKEKSKHGKVNIEIVVTEPKKSDTDEIVSRKINANENNLLSPLEHKILEEEITVDSSNCELHGPIKKPDLVSKINELKKMVSQKHPLKTNKGKTWAAVLTKEQDDFLCQLKQSDYYKNFASPAKSIVSDISCNENMSNLTNARESAEQNMFELLERKATRESFSLENSFINRFIRNRTLECSGESTPLIMQRCLSDNPNLMHIFPEFNHKRNQISQSVAETCESVCSDCCNDASSSVSSCCSCKTVENNELQNEQINKNPNKNKDKKTKSCSDKESTKKEDVKQTDTDTVTENDLLKANMEEMNAKLIATSDLLKDRLHELEDEIETFRKENANLTKMREEIDTERQKFYEEKQAFESKLQEEKILSEYYLADEKEKLSKQKQMYERYVREMRGRLNKKDKDEVVNLKKEISDLKDDIRLKDAKSTSTIARLRNQIKIMEKENKSQQDELEKLKKENRRIQHSNEISRRLTNMKYLEEINKKLSHMAKETQSEVDVDRDVKYKAFEIERQSRNRKVTNVPKPGLRSRAKSVPNLKVTSRYAKYFSQRDAASEIEKDTMFVESLGIRSNGPNDDKENLSDCASLKDDESIYNESDNNLERLYTDRFQSMSPKSSRSSLTDTSSNNDKSNSKEHYDNFFIQKSKSSKSPTRSSASPYLKTPTSSNLNASNSPISTNSYKSSQKSPTYVRKIRKSAELNLSDQSNKSRKSPISHLRPNSGDINQIKYIESRIELSPEPITSKSSLIKTNLNPTEIKKPDGSRELRFPNGNAKFISADGKYTKFVYYNGDVKENFYNEGRIKYYYAENKTVHTTHADGLEVLEFADGQVEKRYKDGSSEIRLPNGSVRYYDPKNQHVREEWRFPDGAALTVSANGEQRIVFTNGQIEVHAKDHKRREFPDGTLKLVYNDGTSETRYSSGRVRIKDKHGNLIMDSAPC